MADEHSDMTRVCAGQDVPGYQQSADDARDEPAADDSQSSHASQEAGDGSDFALPSAFFLTDVASISSGVSACTVPPRLCRHRFKHTANLYH